MRGRPTAAETRSGAVQRRTTTSKRRGRVLADDCSTNYDDITRTQLGQAAIVNFYGDTMTFAGVSNATLSASANAGDFTFV
jgi:hypothetical protein